MNIAPAAVTPVASNCPLGLDTLLVTTEIPAPIASATASHSYEVVQGHSNPPCSRTCAATAGATINKGIHRSGVSHDAT